MSTLVCLSHFLGAVSSTAPLDVLLLSVIFFWFLKSHKRQIQTQSTRRTNSLSCPRLPAQPSAVKPQIRWIKKVWSTTSTTNTNTFYHLCLPPQALPTTTARPPAQLHRLQPPTTTSSPCCGRTGGWRRWWTRLDWQQRDLTSADTWTKAWKSKLDVNLRRCWQTSNTFFFFFWNIRSQSTTPPCYLFVSTETIAQG